MLEKKLLICHNFYLLCFELCHLYLIFSVPYVMPKWMMRDWSVYIAEAKCNSLGLSELNAALVRWWLLVDVIFIFFYLNKMLY